jgi:hypothetical protein
MASDTPAGGSILRTWLVAQNIVDRNTAVTPVLKPGNPKGFGARSITSRRSSLATSLAGALSSTATSAVPVLSRGSSRSSDGESVNTDLASCLDAVNLLVEEENGVLVTPNTDRPILEYPCLFSFLDCSESFILSCEWKTHVLSHFRGHTPPDDARCLLCDWEVSLPGKGEGWNAMLDHTSSMHFRIGHSLAASRPDFALFKFLWNRRLVSDRIYKTLMQISGYSSTHLREVAEPEPFRVSANEARERRQFRRPQRIVSSQTLGMGREPDPRSNTRNPESGLAESEARQHRLVASTDFQRNEDARNENDTRARMPRRHPQVDRNTRDLVNRTPSSEGRQIALEDAGASSLKTSTELEVGLLEFKSRAAECDSDESVQDFDLEEFEFSDETSSGIESVTTQNNGLATSSMRALISELMEEFYHSFGHLLKGKAYGCAGQSSSADCSALSSDPSRNTSSGSANSGSDSSRIPRLPSSGKDEGDSRGGRDNEKKGNPLGLGNRRKLACPFHKHDPVTYTCNNITGSKYRTCAGPGFETVSRTKYVGFFLMDNLLMIMRTH